MFFPKLHQPEKSQPKSSMAVGLFLECCSINSTQLNPVYTGTVDNTWTVHVVTWCTVT